MEIYAGTRTRLREIDQECQARLERLEAVVREAERVRAALDQAEHEISEVWGSNLPRQNKLLLAQVIRVRCRHLETTLRQLHQEAAAAAPARLQYRKRWE
jgi:hypothetical protein